MFSLGDSKAFGFHTWRFSVAEVLAECKGQEGVESLAPSFCYSEYQHDLLGSSQSWAITRPPSGRRKEMNGRTMGDS